MSYTLQGIRLGRPPEDQELIIPFVVKHRDGKLLALVAGDLLEGDAVRKLITGRDYHQLTNLGLPIRDMDPHEHHILQNHSGLLYVAPINGPHREIIRVGIIPQVLRPGYSAKNVA